MIIICQAAIYIKNHEDDVKTLAEAINYIQESDYPTEESKSKIICKSFKIDKNEILNQDEKLKEEAVKMFLDNFLVLALYLNHYGKTDVLEFVIHKKRSEKMNLEYQLDNELKMN